MYSSITTNNHSYVPLTGVGYNSPHILAKEEMIKPHEYDERNELVADHGPRSWQVRSYTFLHQSWVIMTLAALLALDVIILISVLSIETFSPPCEVVLDQCVCDNCSNKHCAAHGAGVDQAIVALNSISMGILCIFLLELSLHSACLGIKRVFRHPFLILDFCVVLASFVIEAYFMSLDSLSSSSVGESEVIATSLLLFARGWRVLRIGHSAFAEAHDLYEAKMEAMEKEIRELKELLHLPVPSTT